MGIANVNLTDTFDQWRLKTNQVILYANQLNDEQNLVFDTLNAAYTLANSNYDVSNIAFDTTNAAYTVLNAAYTSANANYVVTNSSFDRVNSVYDLTNSVFTQSNTDNIRLSAAYVVANAAYNNANVGFVSTNNYANLVGTSGNAYTVVVGASGNSYANFVGIAGNTYANLVGTSGNAYTNVVGVSGNAYVNISTDSANSYAGFMANSVNTYLIGVVQILSGNSSNIVLNLTNTQAQLNAAYVVANAAYNNANVGLVSANNYAGAMANSGNVYTVSVGTAGNNYAGAMVNTAASSANNYAGAMVNTAASSANNYSGVMANSVNNYTSTTYLPKTGGTISSDLTVSGNLTVSGTTTYVNTAQLQVGDNIIVLNADIPNTVYSTENAGIEINRGKSNSNAAITWIEVANAWAFTSNTLNAYTTYIASNTLVEGVSQNTTAAFLKANNVAAGANAYSDTKVAKVFSNGSGRVWANTITSGTFQNVYIDLATSGVTATIYGGASQIPVITVDAYGRLTSAANVTVQGMDYPYANNAANSSNNYAGVMANSVNNYTSATYAPKSNPTLSSPTFTGTVDITGANVKNQTLTDAATIAWNTASGSIATVTLGASRTMGTPTNLKVGTYILHVYQDSTGGWTLDFTSATVFKWPAGSAPVITDTPNAHDVLSFVCDGTYLYGSWLPDVS